LIAITDIAKYGARTVLERLELIAKSARPGRVMLQLRDRGLPVRERLEVGRRLRWLANEHQQLFVVNDRLDLALCLGADGAHLGEHSVTARDARQLLGQRAWLSVACHTPEVLFSRDVADADMLVLSPVFESRKGNPALGEKVLEACRQRLVAAGRQQTLVALGGVDAPRAERVASQGVSVAAIGALFEARDVLPLLEAAGSL
jgi:thiamine-phosphate diphosphorylase